MEDKNMNMNMNNNNNNNTNMSTQNREYNMGNDDDRIIGHHNTFFRDFFDESNNLFSHFDTIRNRMLENFENNFGFRGGLLDDFSFNRELENQRNFSDLHRQISDSSQSERQQLQQQTPPSQSQSGNQGTTNSSSSFSIAPYTSVSKSYVMRSKRGTDGKPVQQKYFSNNVCRRDANGDVISEKKTGYRDSLSNKDVITEEQMLNNQGRKFIRERGEDGKWHTTNHFMGIDQGRSDDFEKRWNEYGSRLGFDKTSKQYLDFDREWQSEKPFQIEHDKGSDINNNNNINNQQNMDSTSNNMNMNNNMGSSNQSPNLGNQNLNNNSNLNKNNNLDNTSTMTNTSGLSNTGMGQTSGMTNQSINPSYGKGLGPKPTEQVKGQQQEIQENKQGGTAA